MYILAADATWLIEHGRPGLDGWFCKKAGTDIVCTEIGRSLHDGPFPFSGSGKVVKVGHLHCPTCQPDWKGPRYGEPIKLEQLTEDGGQQICFQGDQKSLVAFLFGGSVERWRNPI